MRKLLLSLCVLAIGTDLFGQATTVTPPTLPPPVPGGVTGVSSVYHENFDPPSGADSVTTGQLGTVPPATPGNKFNDTNYTSVSAPYSYHSQVKPFDTVVFTTDAFSTGTNTFVLLQFYHKCIVSPAQRAKIQVSNDNGATWTSLTSAHYSGASTSFPTTGYFNQASYPADATIWGTPSAPAPGMDPATAQWVQETFNISAIAASSTQVKIRFRLEQFVNVPSVYHGWFVDNINVLAAPCELTPPAVTFNLTPPIVPAYVNQPLGPQYQIDQKIGIEATDASGIDSVRLYFNVNDTGWARVPMTLVGGTNRYEYIISGLDNADTCWWYVVAYDGACPNYTRRPNLHPQAYRFWKEPTPPQKCGTVSGSTFPQVIVSFPWTEDFEGPEWVAGTGNGNSCCSHRGTFPTNNPYNWEYALSSTSSQFGWSIRNGATPSTTTGPSENHTPGGSKLIYLESSGSNPSGGPVNTFLVTPCIDLTDPTLGCLALEFYYHMFGSNMGRLRIDIDTGETTPSYYNNYWQIQGQQQGSKGAPWQKAFIPIDEFVGKIIRIRFTGMELTSGDNCDMAIDDIRVYEPTPVDMEMVLFDTPKNGYCGYSSSEAVTVAVKNLGCEDIDSIPVAYNLNGTTYWDTVYQNLVPGDSTMFTFSQTANLGAFINHSIKVWVNATGDPLHGNDSIGPRTIEHEAPLNTFPYVENFNGAGWVPGNGTFSNPGTFGSTEWTASPVNTANNFSWHVGTGLTNTNQTGPYAGYMGTGNYLYTEGDYGTSPTVALLVSRCVDLTSMTNPTMDFLYHVYGGDIGGLAVQVKGATSNTYAPIGTTITTANSGQSDELNAWNFQRIDLSAHAGTVIQLRIVAQKTGPGSAADIAIDNLQIFDRISTDVGVLNIQPPGFGLPMPAGSGPTLKLVNYGTTAATNFPVVLTVTPDCGGTPQTYTANYTGTAIAPGASVNWVFPTVPTYAEGSTLLHATTNMTGDTHTWNNEFQKRTTPFTTISIPYFNNFDNCSYDADGWYADGVTVDTYRFWQVGNPGFGSPSGAHSTPNAWVTNPGANYRPNADEALRIPNVVGFDSIESAELRFWQKFDFSNDAGVVEFFGPTGWEALGDASTQNGKIGWYDDPNYGGSNIPALGGGPGFQGNTAGQWVYAQYPLGFMNNNPNPLGLRFRLTSDAGSTSHGWAIDDFEIYVPPQNSAAPTNITTVQKLRIPGSQNIAVRIENTGAKTLDSCNLTVWVDNVLLATEKVVFDPPLLRGQSRYDTIWSAAWLNASSGNHNVCAYTSLPNDRTDKFPQDDSLCMTINILDVVPSLNDTLCYFDDFEGGSNPWYTANAYTYSDGLTSWEQGAPSQTYLNAAFSGTQAWMTNLNGNYKSRDSSALFTPVFEVETDTSYEISFKHNYRTERFHDGGVVEVTMDGGITWAVIGFVAPQWFNTQYVTGLEVTKPGWTYESNGWVTAKTTFQFDIDAPGTGQAIFRFRFGSDQGIEDEGWAVDDFCFRRTAKNPVYTIGEEETLFRNLALGNLMPNPTSGTTYLPLTVVERTNLNLTVTNLMGQTLAQQEHDLSAGEHLLELATANWSNGIYMVTVTINGQRLTQKLVVNH